MIMAKKIIILLGVLIFVSILILSCKGSAFQTESDIQVRITEKKFIRSTCIDNVSEALSIAIRTILQNTTEVTGKIEDWKLDFYSDSVLLISISKSNYEDYACGGQAVDFSDEIKTSGFFNFYGFVKFSLFKNITPNRVTITLTIKDTTGKSYQISDTY